MPVGGLEGLQGADVTRRGDMEGTARNDRGGIQASDLAPSFLGYLDACRLNTVEHLD